MKTHSCLLLALALITSSHASDNMMPTLERNGRLYVSAKALERDAGIAIKSLPGQKEIAACFQERCALLNDHFREGDDSLIGVMGLAEALAGTAKFDEKRKNVSFQIAAKGDVPSPSSYRVGHLAPNFRLTKLDGTPVALSDLRGQRVVINSWASW